MKLATTTSDFAYYGKGYRESLELIREAGFKYVDLSMYTPFENDELLLSDNWKENAKKLREFAENLGLTFVQAHSPGGNALDENDAQRTIDLTIRSILVCGELGIPNTVVHAGCADGIGKDEFYEKNKVFYEKLFPAMEETGVNVLTENSTNANMHGRYYLIDGEDMRNFIKYVNHPLLHGCWDTGHANIEGVQYEHIKALGDELYALHINDNCGKMDEHIIPYFGTVNMDDVMHGLIDIGYNGYFTFEATNTLRPADYPYMGSRRRFESDKRLFYPSLFMQKHMERLMYEIGEHILKKYDMFSE